LSCGTDTLGTRRTPGQGYSNEEALKQNRQNKGKVRLGLPLPRGQRCGDGGKGAKPSAWPGKRKGRTYLSRPWGTGHFMNTQNELLPFGTKAKKGRAGVKVAQQTRYYSM
jgi:hypothetical protein